MATQLIFLGNVFVLSLCLSVVVYMECLPYSMGLALGQLSSVVAVSIGI